MRHPFTGKLRRPLAVLAAVAAIGVARPASATLIDVQFQGTFTFSGGAPVNPAQQGAAVIGAAGDQWNSVSATSATGIGLQTTAGAASGVGLSFTAAGAYTAGPTYDAFVGTPYFNLMDGYLVNPQSISLSGLGASQTFSLYVYTQGDNNSNGRSISLVANGTSEVATQSNAGTFIQNDNYLLFTGNADANGLISISSTTLAIEGNINGLQLLTADAAPAADVPEPASMAVLGFAAVAVGVTRRRLRG